MFRILVEVPQVEPSPTHAGNQRRARREANKRIAAFARDNLVAIRLIQDTFDSGIQDELSRALEIDRQLFTARWIDVLSVEYLTNLHFHFAEQHSETRWVLCDLEYERDKSRGLAYLWQRHHFSNPDPITGPQLSFSDVAEKQ